jgi:hypothetical protein
MKEQTLGRTKKSIDFLLDEADFIWRFIQDAKIFKGEGTHFITEDIVNDGEPRNIIEDFKINSQESFRQFYCNNLYFIERDEDYSTFERFESIINDFCSTKVRDLDVLLAYTLERAYFDGETDEY